LTEILQLVTAYPYLLNQNLLPLITSIAHLIADASPSVRAASLNLLRHICDSLPPQSVVSVSQGLVLFTLSALSNLDEAIRIDALKVLDLLIEKIPEEIVRGWDGGADVHVQLGKSAEEKGTGSKVVEGLLGMLKIRNPALTAAQGSFTSASSSDLSPSVSPHLFTSRASEKLIRCV
jgi:pre-rRNA-processing protein IPI1